MVGGEHDLTNSKHAAAIRMGDDDGADDPLWLGKIEGKIIRELKTPTGYALEVVWRCWIPRLHSWFIAYIGS